MTSDELVKQLEDEYIGKLTLENYSEHTLSLLRNAFATGIYTALVEYPKFLKLTK